MIIRSAGSKDMKTVFKLLREVTGKMKVGTNAPEVYINLLKRRDVVMVLAEEGRQAAGLLIAYEIPKVLDGNTRMMIDELVVNPEFQGTGIRTQLLHFIETLAYGRGCDGIS